MRKKQLDRLLAALSLFLLAYLVFVVFHPVASFDFINLDVIGQVVKNPNIQGLDSETLKYVFTPNSKMSYYPVRALTYAIDRSLWDLNPGGFKATNVLLHCGCVVLLWGLILRLLRQTEAAASESNRWGHLLAATTGAGLLAVHPVVVEPVVWVPGREELLMTLAGLACLHCHISVRALQHREASGRRVFAWQAATVLFCLAACLSNAVGAVIPLLVTAYDRVATTGPKWRKIASAVWPLWVVGGLTIAIKKVGDSMNPASLENVDYASLERITIVLRTYWLNVTTLFWPTRLTLEYPDIDDSLGWETGAWLGLGLVAATAAALWLVRRRKLALLGLVWFVLALAPTAQIMPHHVQRADRFLYLPLLGLALLLAVGMLQLTKKVRGNAARGGLVVMALLMLFTLEWAAARQVHTWKDSVTRWTSCLQLYPDNVFAMQCLGDTLQEQGRFEEAAQFYELAIQTAPEEVEMATLNNYALALATCEPVELRDYPRAIQLATQGVRSTNETDPKLRRTLAMAHMNYATSLRDQFDYQRAIDHYQLAAEADPDYPAPRYNLAMLLAGCDDEEFRRPAEAIRIAEETIGLTDSPDSIQFALLAAVYAEASRFGRAIAAIDEAILRAETEDDPDWSRELRQTRQSYQTAKAAEE